MSVEFLDESQPWLIHFPQEPDPRRPLEARQDPTGGHLMRRWDGTQDDCGRWLRTHDWRHHEGQWDRWHEIVGSCMNMGWTLSSLPVEAAVDAT